MAGGTEPAFNVVHDEEITKLVVVHVMARRALKLFFFVQFYLLGQ